jgi:diadenosine tetraphosphate (Ap4A) HIT family hydrolase
MTPNLHPRLAADTHFVAKWPLCEVRLQDNRLFPWLVLVPQCANVCEIIDLGESDQAALMREIARASRALKTLLNPDKLNVAALGNVVPQLHVHVIARFKTDAAWDKPVWGQGTQAYTPDALEEFISRLRAAFTA